MIAISVNLPLAGVLEAKDGYGQVTSQDKQGPEKLSSLFARCADTVVDPSPLSERPVLERATFASKPQRPHTRRKVKARKPRARKAVAHKPAAHKVVRKTVARARPRAIHRPAAGIGRPPARTAHRPVLQRLTYASPLCGERSHALNELVGLPDVQDVTQSLVVADNVPVQNQIFTLPGLGGGTVTTPTGPSGPVIVFPTGPTFPVGPTGPVIVPPVGPGTPPTTAVPEPASWATMLLGFLLVGGTIRRRKSLQQA